MKKFQLGTLAAIVVASGITLAACAEAKNEPAASGNGGGDPVVLMKTTKGDIKIKIFKSQVPITANNFLDLVNRHFYDGLSFHRFEPGFVIQGGDPLGNGSGGFIDPKTKSERTIKLEKVPGLRHDSAGVMAMARSNDPNSASSQFYFTLGPASFLDMNYAVFGKVVDGLKVVESLRQGGIKI